MAEFKAHFPFHRRKIRGTLMLPTLNIPHGKPLSKKVLNHIRNTRKRSNEDIIQLLAKSKNTISGPLRALDGPGSSLDLPIFQRLLNRKGLISLDKLSAALNLDQADIVKAFDGSRINGPCLDVNRCQDLATQFHHLPLEQLSQAKRFELEQLFIHANSIVKIPMTLTAASELRLTLSLEPASSPDVVEYIAEDFHITAENPMRFSEPVNLDEVGENKQRYAAFYIFINLFAIKGVRIILEPVPSFALAGGMESSNAFNIALLLIATQLTGAELTYGDLFNLGVKIENDEFDGNTGGQGHVCYLGLNTPLSLNCWTSGMAPKGRKSLGYGMFAADVLTPKFGDLLEKHVVLIQAGKEYEAGSAVVERTSAVTNTMWVQLLEDFDAVGYPVHLHKLKLCIDFVTSIMRLNFKHASEVVYQYVSFRNYLVKRWITLLLLGQDAFSHLEIPSKMRQQASKYYDAVFNKDNPLYDTFEVLRWHFDHDPRHIENINFYTYEAHDLVNAAWEKEIAIMPLGAGGPGAILFSCSAHGAEYIMDFLQHYHPPYSLFNNNSASQIIQGTGTLQGYLPLKLDHSGLIIKGFDGTEKLTPPHLATYDQFNGSFESCGTLSSYF